MKKIILLASAFLLSMGAFAQQENLNTRAREAKKAGGAQLEQFKKELKGMLNTKSEETYLSVVNAYYTLGEEATSDSIQEVIKKKFPKGILNRNNALNALYKIKGGQEMEKAYKNWMKTYPKAKMGEDIVYDYAAYSVANNYAEENNAAKAEEYLALVTDPAWSCTAHSVIGGLFEKNKNLDEAAKIYAKGCAAADKAEASIPANNPRRMELSTVRSRYADVLMKQGKKDEAAKYYEKVPVQRRGLGYAQLMNEQGHAMQAFTFADGLMRNGAFDPEIIDLLKASWQKANGNLDGCEAYINGVKAKRIQDKKAEVAKTMISEKAPNFELKDSKGETVRLADLKGKVVVLDFWATWCGPCKNSLPAMKMTVDKYKDDPNVAFLFIHTWEHGTPEAALKDATEYLNSHGFGDFHLVMDTKNPATRKNDGVTAYGVTGIPAKFIIDPQGNIRFKVSGFSGSNDEAVAELSQMIEMARRGK